EELDIRFREFAERRFNEMRNRPEPRARPSLPELRPGGVIAVCIEPVFESIFMDERAMRKALGLHGTRTKGWPSGWSVQNVHANDVVGAAVDAARDAGTGNALFRRIRQGYETQKTEWGIHFLQSGAFTAAIKCHPLGKRLAEIRVVSPKIS